MKQYLLVFALVLALIACSQKGTEPKSTSQDHNDQEIINSDNTPKDSKKDLTVLAEENSVPLFNGNKIFVSKEKNSAGKYELRATVDTVELKGVSDKNNGSGKLEGTKADKTKVAMTIADDLNTITVETYDASNKKTGSEVVKKQGSVIKESYKANKLDSKKITRENETTLEYSEMTDSSNDTKAVETLKNGIKLEGSLVGGKTTVKLTEGTITLTREIEQDGKVKIYLNDTTSGSTKKTATWNETTNTLTISADSKKTKDFVFLTDGTITVQAYDTAGTKLEGNSSEIKDLAALKAALK
ncbi:borrelia lipoprotein (plasmid) [Borreliella afzelii ACA-1]|uniref:outer surface lipoprotein OspB n=1 Tax=Borreliella afzelii TaxID=29518 RepID=UPI0000148953|nr:borrelia lipoprotein [Borreliella afzelii ACA-1]